MLALVQTPDAPGNQAESGPARADIAGVSPVRLIPRVEIRNQSAKLDDGTLINTTVLRLDSTYIGRFLLRYDLPIVFVSADGRRVSGLGDVAFQGVLVLTSGRRQVTGLIGGVVLNTATRPELGAGKEQLFFGAAGALSVYPWWLPYLIIEEQISVAGDSARPDVNQLLVRLGNIFFDSAAHWYKLDLDTRVDFTRPTGQLFATVEVGSLLVGRVGIFMNAGTQLLGPRSLDYTVEAGIRYLFGLR